MVTVGVHTLIARLMSDRTDQFVVGRRGRLRAVVKAGWIWGKGPGLVTQFLDFSSGEDFF